MYVFIYVCMYTIHNKIWHGYFYLVLSIALSQKYSSVYFLTLFVYMDFNHKQSSNWLRENVQRCPECGMSEGAFFRMLTVRSAKGGGFKFDEVTICDIGGRKLAIYTSIVFISSWPPFQLN